MNASTAVYESLQNEESLMWSESAEYIADEYYRTLDGDPKCQKYL